MSEVQEPVYFDCVTKSETDQLDHNRQAQQVLSQLCLIRPGGTIAIQGPWGRGKTDLLGRLHDEAAERSRSQDAGAGSRIVASVHLNPWSYGEPNLLTPLVVKLLERIPPKKRSGKVALQKAASTLIRCGTNFGLKATGLLVPAAGLVTQAAAEQADDLLKGLFEALDEQERPDIPDPDPIAAMGLRFAELVSALVAAANGSDNDRVLITLDDLDRCLPSRQVALLEAIHFLTTAESAARAKTRAVFAIALDPRLVSSALLTHYNSGNFDASGYLNKLFDARVDLPSLQHGEIQRAIQQLLAPALAANQLGALFSANPENYQTQQATALQQFAVAMYVPEYRNMRVVHRLCNKLRLLMEGRANGAIEPIAARHPQDMQICFSYLALCECFQELRAHMQHCGNYTNPIQQTYTALLNSKTPGRTPIEMALREFQLPANADYGSRLYAVLDSGFNNKEYGSMTTAVEGALRKVGA